VEGAVSLSRHSLLALCMVLFGAIAPGGAHAQASQDKPFDFKPFIPPIIPLPPNAQVAPGALGQTPTASDPAPITNPYTPPPASGLRITIPTR